MNLNTNVVANIKRMSEIDNEMQAIKAALAKLTAQKSLKIYENGTKYN